MNARLNRLFAADGRCLSIAVDHGLVGEPRWLAPMVDIAALVGRLLDGGADALVMAIGHAGVLQSVPGPDKAALIVRADIANPTASADDVVCSLFNRVVDRAVALDAAAIVAAVFLLPGRTDLRVQCLRNVDQLRAACDQFAMPLVVEVLANDNIDADDVTHPETMAAAVRQVRELGADVVKCDATHDPRHYGLIVEAAAGAPVLVGGGVPVSEADLVQRSRTVMSAGARGLCYGRNVVWASDPAAVTRALHAVVHD